MDTPLEYEEFDISFTFPGPQISFTLSGALRNPDFMKLLKNPSICIPHAKAAALLEFESRPMETQFNPSGEIQQPAPDEAFPHQELHALRVLEDLYRFVTKLIGNQSNHEPAATNYIAETALDQHSDMEQELHSIGANDQDALRTICIPEEPAAGQKPVTGVVKHRLTLEEYLKRTNFSPHDFWKACIEIYEHAAAKNLLPSKAALLELVEVKEEVEGEPKGQIQASTREVGDADGTCGSLPVMTKFHAMNPAFVPFRQTGNEERDIQTIIFIKVELHELSTDVPQAAAG
ncbi:hypothetical protein DFH09DRAFT_1088278 [Mycena vulgaris]|nr:hypothetical protein DFH09DRAFT_1088278 [Mycena vulgaris]